MDDTRGYPHFNAEKRLVWDLPQTGGETNHDGDIMKIYLDI